MNNQLTKRGIAYNLEISPYHYVVKYEDEELQFVFSSKRYVDIFSKKIEENRNTISKSLTNRFGFEINVDKLSDIKLYASVEKRGFLIRGKEEYKCLSIIKLDGQTLTKRN